jgi:hypothetical protein
MRSTIPSSSPTNEPICAVVSNLPAQRLPPMLGPVKSMNRCSPGRKCKSLGTVA